MYIFLSIATLCLAIAIFYPKAKQNSALLKEKKELQKKIEKLLEIKEEFTALNDALFIKSKALESELELLNSKIHNSKEA